MTVQFSTTVRNAVLDAVETAIGASAILKIFTGAKPADCGTANSGTVLATLNLPSDYMSAASGGSKSKTGTWEDLSCDNAGTAGHYRIFASDGTTCHEQGSITATGGGGDMELDNTVLAAGQQFTVTNKTLTASGA